MKKIENKWRIFVDKMKKSKINQFLSKVNVAKPIDQHHTANLGLCPLIHPMKHFLFPNISVITTHTFLEYIQNKLVNPF